MPTKRASPSPLACTFKERQLVAEHRTALYKASKRSLPPAHPHTSQRVFVHTHLSVRPLPSANKLDLLSPPVSSHGSGLLLPLAGALRRARQGRRVRDRPGAGLPDPPQLLQRLLQGQQPQVPQLPADAVHER
jgi:hypothetical protein